MGTATPLQRPPAADRARRGAARRLDATTVLELGIAALALYHLALGAFMVLAPHSFFEAIGPFGTRNDHYIRDNATFNLALGAGLAVALSRRAWRVPLLAVVTLQFALHSLNHLADIGKSHPAWVGPADFAALAVTALALVWLLRAALGERRSSTELDPGPNPNELQ